MNRLVKRLIALGIVLLVVPAVVTFFRSTPLGTIVALFGVGILAFVVVSILAVRRQEKSVTERNVVQDIQKPVTITEATDKDIVEEFSNRVVANPMETKKLYVELKKSFGKYQQAVQLHQWGMKDRLKDWQLQESAESVQRWKGQVLDDASKLYNQRAATKELLEQLEEKIKALEAVQVRDGVAILLAKLRQDPEGTKLKLDELKEVLYKDPVRVMELSAAVFDGVVFLWSPTVSKIAFEAKWAMEHGAIYEGKNGV